MSTPVPPPSSPAPSPPKFDLPRVLLIALLLVGIAGAVYAIFYYANRDTSSVDTLGGLRGYLTQQADHMKMAEGYTDADKDLVADTPTDSKLLVNPPELVFSAVSGDDATEAGVMWQPLMQVLGQKTGKPVKYLSDAPVPATEEAPASTARRTLDDQLEALKTGKLHVTAFSTGQVPRAVNTAGFVPLFAPASADGKFAIQMSVIVPASSKATQVPDLKGQTIAFVALSSNSGGKAPLVIFKEKFGMLPGRDYEYKLTGDHRRSIRELVEGQQQHSAACVASDILEQMVEKGDVKADQFKLIFSSAEFPPLCFGVPHNLDPKVRAAVESTFRDFGFEGNTVGERYKAQKRVKFTAVNYKDHWKDVREIDDKLAKLLD